MTYESRLGKRGENVQGSSCGFLRCDSSLKIGRNWLILSLQTTTIVLPTMVIILVKLKKELPVYSLVIFFQEKIVF